MKSVCIIPARAGSKRLKNKNIYPVHGKPMFYWPYLAALNSNLYDEIYLSTDSQEYVDLAVKLNVKTILRPHDISNDKAMKQDAIVHAKNFLMSQGKMFDLYMSLQANSPDVTSQDLIQIHNKLIEDKRWEVVTVDSNYNQNGVARLMKDFVVDIQSLSAVLGFVVLDRANIHTSSDVKTLLKNWNPNAH